MFADFPGRNPSGRVDMDSQMNAWWGHNGDVWLCQRRGVTIDPLPPQSRGGLSGTRHVPGQPGAGTWRVFTR